MNSFCMVARFKIISDQGAFDGPYGRSRTMCFRFELLLQSLGACTKFSEKCSLQAILRFWAALPGAQPWKGLRPHEKRLDMACRDYKQYFIRDNGGKIVRQWWLYFLYVSASFGLVFRGFLAILSTDFGPPRIKN